MTTHYSLPILMLAVVYPILSAPTRIIDTHIHIFDPSRPGGVPFPAKGSPLYKTTLPEHFDAVAKPAGVTGTVVVEASGILEDNQWVLDRIRDLPHYPGMVGALDPGKSGFSTHLQRFSADPKFLGIRVRANGMQPTHRTAAFYRDLRELAEKGLILDLQLTSMESLARDAAAITKEVPEIPIMLNHLAHGPVDGKTPNSEWTQAVKAIAENPRVYCKVSALVNLSAKKPAPTETSYYAPVLDVLWEAFGSERLVYGSNWPVSDLGGTFANQQEVVIAYFRAKGDSVLENVMWRNAEKFYLKQLPTAISLKPVFRSDGAAQMPRLVPADLLGRRYSELRSNRWVTYRN